MSHILLMGQATEVTKGRVMLNFLKIDGEEAREPTCVVRFMDAIETYIKRGYALVEQTSPDEGVYQVRLTQAPVAF